MKLKYHNWNEVPIKVYNKIVSIMKDYDEKPELYIIPILSILYNEPENDIGLLKIGEVQKMMKDSSWINNFSFDKNNRITELNINGTDCRIKYDLSEFTYQQYLDYNDFFLKVEEDPSYLANVLATFILPKNKKYNDGYNLQQLTDDIEDYLPITQCQTIIYFFLISCGKLLHPILTSLESKETKKMMMKAKLKIK